MKQRSVKIVKNYKAPIAPGKHHRVMCMTGESKGISYFLEGARVVLGRSDDADIIVLDVKSSRQHAEMALVNEKYIVTDLGSQNGIIVNDLKVTQHKLTDGDKVIIGQTVYKYNFLNIADEYALEETNEDDSEEENDRDDSEDLYDDSEDELVDNSEDKTKKNDKSKKRRLMIIGVALLAVLFLFDDEEKPVTKRKPASTGLQDVTDTWVALSSKKEKEESKQVRIKLAAIIHRGQREYREKNYYRAMSEFNLALVLSPQNSTASFYLRKTKQALDEEIEQNFIKARQENDALKYHAAAISYCTIIRMLDGYSEDKRFKDAAANIEVIEERLGLDKGEINCL